jgi:alpha-glucosidase
MELLLLGDHSGRRMMVITLRRLFLFCPFLPITSMSIPIAKNLAAFAASICFAAQLSAVGIPPISSPDGRITMAVDAVGGLSYSVQLDGQPLLVKSALGLVLADGTQLGSQSTTVSVVEETHDSTWQQPFGKASTIRDHYRELRVRFSEPRPAPASAVVYELHCRAYNDGVAWRYVFPEAGSPGAFTVTENRTEFLFTGDHRAWIGAGADAECQYPEIRLSQLPTDRRVLPLVVQAPNAVVAVAEADVRDWAASMLVTAGRSGSFGAKASLVSQVQTQSPRQSPWHALMIAHNAGDLTLSHLLCNLATPSQIADLSWIKPGISAWDVWWTGRNPYWPQHNGLYARGNTQSHKDFIDYAAEMGWPYMLIDWFWYDQDSSDPDTAIKALSHIDMPELMAHAAAKGVKLILWVNSKNIPSIGADRLFRTYREWGAVGVKIDFFSNNGSQGTQRWMEELAAQAAAHQLVVDFHGVHTPTGLSRTWPNVLTQEGVLAVEYVKLGYSFTPEHMMRLPFTRALLGPADVTPAAFLNVRPDQFASNSVPSTVTGTRARHLAFTMLIDSPYLCMVDAPENYREEPGLNFLRQLPTTWDETRSLSAELMTHLIQARRKGNGWWLAGMNLEQPLELTLNLDFLGDGDYTLTTYSDTPDSNQRPAALAEQSRVVRRGDTINVRMETTGGFAATLSPVVTPPQPRVISYNWDFYGTIPSDATSVAGVVPAAHWNNSYPARNWPAVVTDPVTSMKDNFGAATSMDFYFSHSAQWQLNPSNTAPLRDTDGTYNKRLLKGYADMFNGQPLTLTLSEIPFNNYEVYVYLSSDTANREGYATDGTNTFFFRTAGSSVINDGNASLIQATDTTDLSVNAPATYSRFSSLSGPSQNITVFAQGNAGIAGFQVVEVLPTPTNDYMSWMSSTGITGGMTDDADGDSLSNFEEYAFGLNPTLATSVNPIRVAMDRTTGVFQYSRRMQSQSGLSYSIWTSTDLQTWTEDRGAREGAPILEGEIEIVPVTLSTPPRSDKFFIRVRTP